MAKNQYKYGREKEQKVARSLRNKGAKVDVSKSSKGSADLVAKFSTGTTWNVQVKATRAGTAASPSAKDSGRRILCFGVSFCTRLIRLICI